MINKLRDIHKTSNTKT